MTDQEIFKLALEKAHRNGYDVDPRTDKWWYETSHQFGTQWVVQMRERAILFDHDFAKAFWGEEMVCKDCGGEKGMSKNCRFIKAETLIPKWQCHLQQMVLEENPVKYLEQFLEEAPTTASEVN